MNRVAFYVGWITLAALGALSLVIAFGASPVLAGETGVLKLEVSECKQSEWLNNAHIEVIIYRPGVGQVDSDSGYTDSNGYIELTFDDLENADEARTTVTPSGGSSDSGHTYYWVAGDERNAGAWDFEIFLDTLCADSWYDQDKDIIHCKHNN